MDYEQFKERIEEDLHQARDRFKFCVNVKN